MDAEPGPHGEQAWILFDPMSAKYFRIGRVQMEILQHLESGDLETVANLASDGASLDVAAIEVQTFIEFLRKNNLVEGDAEQQKFYSRFRAAKPGWVSWLAKGYLFLRIPLVRPDAFLERTLPYVAWLGSRWVMGVLAVLGLIGLVWAVRQWDVFWATFLYFFSVQGAIVFGLALIVVKVMHELGHAFVAKAQGCRVPVIGVAFLVLWPVLYTDSTDTWKLKTRGARLKVGVAGVAVEIAVGAVALFAWSFMPDGPLRSLCFVLATTTWVASLAVNLNPLMRFDGYYLISDLLREPNLEQRAHAVARWRLRKWLFGFLDTPPEPPKTRLIVYSFSIWIYRFLLFLGIALLVYHMFFKVLGIILFAVEIVYFILAPIGREVREWHRRKQQLTWNRQTVRTIILISFVMAATFIPWKTHIEVPALMKRQHVVVYAPGAGRLEALSISPGVRVDAGQLLLRVNAPEIDFELAQARYHHQTLVWQRASLGFDPTTLSRALVIASELATQSKRLYSLEERKNRLSVMASTAGEIVDVEPDLEPDQWVGDGMPLFAIKVDGTNEAVAYFDENDVGRLREGLGGRFYTEGGGRDVADVTVAAIEPAGLRVLDELYSASLFGGGVAVRQNDRDEMIPARATYRVRFEVDQNVVSVERVIRGAIVLDVEAQSLANRIYRQVVALLIRESAF